MESLPVREGEAYEKAKRRGGGLSVREDSGNLREQVVHNLPTPRAQNGEERNMNIWERPADQPQNLENALANLPTPKARDYKDANSLDYAANRVTDFSHSLPAVVATLPTPRAQVRQDIYNREDYHYNLEEALATLPTPNARDYKDQSFSPRVLDGRSHGELPEIVGRNFLPTPTARDGTKASTNPDTSARRRAAGRQAFLTDIVQTDLMPTPTVMDMGNNKTPEEWAAWKDEQRAKHNNGNSHGESLTQAAIAWGKYEPAIRRWENLTREAPEPTVPHKDKRRLNPAFVEWMMGLPAGHVTGHGLSAAKELKMLGNGVVPQQARSAITQLMERITQ